MVDRCTRSTATYEVLSFGIMSFFNTNLGAFNEYYFVIIDQHSKDFHSVIRSGYQAIHSIKFWKDSKNSCNGSQLRRNCDIITLLRRISSLQHVMFREEKQRSEGVGNLCVNQPAKQIA